MEGALHSGTPQPLEDCRRQLLGKATRQQGEWVEARNFLYGTALSRSAWGTRPARKSWPSQTAKGR